MSKRIIYVAYPSTPLINYIHKPMSVEWEIAQKCAQYNNKYVIYVNKKQTKDCTKYGIGPAETKEDIILVY